MQSEPKNVYKVYAVVLVIVITAVLMFHVITQAVDNENKRVEALTLRMQIEWCALFFLDGQLHGNFTLYNDCAKEYNDMVSKSHFKSELIDLPMVK